MLAGLQDDMAEQPTAIRMSMSFCMLVAENGRSRTGLYQLLFTPDSTRILCDFC